MNCVRQAQDITLPDLSKAVLDAADDPQGLLKKAQEAERSFYAALDKAALAIDVTKLVEPVVKAYKAAMDKANAASMAITHAPIDIANATKALATARGKRQAAFEALSRARKVHADLSKADTLLKTGEATAKQAESFIAKAQRELDEHRYVTAQRTALDAHRLAESVDRDYVAVEATIAALDKAKRDYETRLASLGQDRKRAELNIRSYGRQPELKTYEPATVTGPADYGLLLGGIIAVQSDWGTQEQAARAEREAEIRAAETAERQRREDARRAEEQRAAAIRRQEEEDDRRRRSSDTSSSYPSSGSSYDGDDSSSGGSFGGGDSSSGGSW
jgi:uncharacterized membrane protein YgcG